MENLVKIQAELKAPKNQRNNFGKYNYRSCEDILEALKPLLLKYNCTIHITDEVKEVCGLAFIESTVIFKDELGEIKSKAQAGIDANRKGMDIAQSFGSSSSYARKYALNGMFLIDDTKDLDATNTHGKGATSTADKKWLNKDTPEFEKVKKYIAGGGNLSKVEDKYKISKEVKQLLK